MIDMTDADRQQLIAAVDRVHVETETTVSLDALVDHWTKLASQVEEGYDRTIDDYINFLMSRDLLGEIIRLLPLEFGQRFEQLVLSAPDTRFRLATRELPNPIRFADADSGWWWRRVPIAMSEEMTAALFKEGRASP
jgi:hypothetical protein